MITIAFILIVGLFSWYVFSPLFTGAFKNTRWNPEHTETEQLRLRKQEILVALNDLEYDVKMKKMSDADYLQIREGLMREGSAVIEALHKLELPKQTPKLKGKRNRSKTAVA